MTDIAAFDTVEDYLMNAAKDGGGWRTTAQVAEAFGCTITQARMRLEASQIAKRCECRLDRGTYLWRALPQ